MLFCNQLSADYPDKSYGADRVYSDMLDQAILVDKLGFDAVSLTEHHLVNVLMNPAPLQLAVKIASLTERLRILMSVAVLPLHDMRIYAGELVMTDFLTNGRMYLGVGRGAFAFEMERLGVPMAEGRERFDESLDVLQKLLTQEEVSYSGKYYNFDPITIMPRPVDPAGIKMMMAVLNPDGIYHCTKRGFHIQTTPLSGNHQMLVDQVAAFKRAKDEMGEAGTHLTISVSRLAHVASSPAEKQRQLGTAAAYYARFDNVFTGPGIVDAGMVRPLPRKQSLEELAAGQLICSAGEMVDQLGVYADLGIDRVILNTNFGLPQQQTLEALEAIAREVMPHFAQVTNAA